jgi:DNA-binding NarL/FixJ family response regulator
MIVVNPTQQSIIKVLIVDDHQMYIDGLKLVLRKVENIKVAAFTNNTERALEILSEQDIDIVISDIRIQGCAGTKLTRQIKKYNPEIKVLIVSSFNDREIVKEIFSSEAEGYILKNAGKQVLIDAINKICAGGIFYSCEVADIMMESNRIRKRQIEQTKNLSVREMEILKLICIEYTTNEIAAKLYISPLTVETHRKHILQKTNSKSIVGLIKFAIENSLV